MRSDNFSLGRVEVRQPPLERFQQYLQRSGKRATSQRRVIVEQVFSHHDHFDADELMQHLHDWIVARKVSRPTVYRTLAELVEAGLLRSMNLAGRTVYEHDYGYPRHDHLYSQVCNALIEFHSPQIERLRDTVAKEHQFQVTGHRMFITGVCAACREKGLGNANS